ncbi:MAG TPA: pyruvate formate-lyase-activating protein [Noviherbaspirillum sp.]
MGASLPPGALACAGPGTVAGGHVHAVETFGAADGPGLRYVLFTAGCRMRCLYCHNPDSWTMRDGQWKTVGEVVDDIGRYAAFFRRTGGLTISGGEPLMQPDFVGKVFHLVKQRHGLHTALDTNGALAARLGDAWFVDVDLVLLDIKHIDPLKHRALTGLDVRPTLDFARRLSDMGKPVWIRHVLVPGHTDAAADVEQLAGFIGTLANVERVEILPFHQLGEYKWKDLGRKYRLKDTPVPGPELIERVKKQFAARGITVTV